MKNYYNNDGRHEFDGILKNPRDISFQKIKIFISLNQRLPLINEILYFLITKFQF